MTKKVASNENVFEVHKRFRKRIKKDFCDPLKKSLHFHCIGFWKRFYPMKIWIGQQVYEKI